MGLIDTIEQKMNNEVVLIDTSALYPAEEIPLAEALHEGLGGLEALDPAAVSSRIGKIQELEELSNTCHVTTIQRVCTEAERLVKILRGQQTYLSREIQESRDNFEPEERDYYQEMLQSIFDYSLILQRYLKRLKQDETQTPNRYASARYETLMHIARENSKDLVLKTHLKNER